MTLVNDGLSIEHYATYLEDPVQKGVKFGKSLKNDFFASAFLISFCFGSKFMIWSKIQFMYYFNFKIW